MPRVYLPAHYDELLHPSMHQVTYRPTGIPDLSQFHSNAKRKKSPDTSVFIENRSLVFFLDVLAYRSGLTSDIQNEH